MRIPGSGPAPLTCGKCLGVGRIEARNAKMGKGWVVVGKKCPNCRGKGKLRTR